MTSYRLAGPGPDDRQFIVSAWSSSQKYTRDIPMIPDALWAKTWHPIVKATLDRPTVVTVIAHGEALHGFICAEANYVIYVYVAQPFRRCGIARELFASVGIDPSSRFGYACRTKASWQCRSKIPLAHYDPFRIRFTQPGATT